MFSLGRGAAGTGHQMPTGRRMPLAWHGALGSDTSQTCTLQCHITDRYTFGDNYLRALAQLKGSFQMSIFSVIVHEINMRTILIKLLGSNTVTQTMYVNHNVYNFRIKGRSLRLHKHI